MPSPSDACFLSVLQPALYVRGHAGAVPSRSRGCCSLVQAVLDFARATLEQVLRDERMVVPNLVVQILAFPVGHVQHEAFLKERRVVGVVNPPQE